MAGRPTRPIDFLGEEQIEVLSKRAQGLYNLFLEESDVDLIKKHSASSSLREQIKRNAHHTYNLFKPTLDIMERLCTQYGGHDEAEEEAMAMARQIAMFEGKASGRKK